MSNGVATAALSTVGLIFGGCCSNVFALEAIIKKEADSGLLITFFQFLLTTGFAYLTQTPLFSPSPSSSESSPLALRPRKVPLQKWGIIAVMFYSINMLNNWAFAFQISVPVHIILRSFGSVTTMLAGWLLAGKTYSRLQVVSVGVLTLGVGVSAWADAVGKGKDVSAKTETSSSTFAIGLSILLLAQLLSAYMGVYVQETYAKYGASWTENLFYSHFLSLPLFLPLAGTLRRQYSRLTATPAAGDVTGHRVHDGPLEPLKSLLLDRMHLSAVPSGVILLFLNALTQMACISGVNLLSATSSAVTVTIVLNIRKLVSFVLSTVIFGHSFSGLMMLGSALVFGSGALYGWETSWRIPSERRRRLRDEAKKNAGK